MTCSNQGGWSTALSQLYNPNKYYPDLWKQTPEQSQPWTLPKKPDILLTGRAHHEYNTNDCSRVLGNSYIMSAVLQLPVTPNPPGSTIRGVFIRERSVSGWPAWYFLYIMWSVRAGWAGWGWGWGAENRDVSIYSCSRYMLQFHSYPTANWRAICLTLCVFSYILVLPIRQQFPRLLIFSVVVFL